MGKIRKIIGILLYPGIAVMIALLPAATVLLVYSMFFLGTDSVIAYVSYMLAAYTLAVWCMKLPGLIRSFKRLGYKNKYARCWLGDTRIRVNVSLYGALAWNTVYAAFQLSLGLWHHTFWYYSLAGYYFLLAAMRFFLVRHTSRHLPGEKMREELIRYRTCGILFLVMNLTLSLMIFFMVYWDRTFTHHEITTISMAAYTFTFFAVAIVNLVKYRKLNSPVYSASKAISLAAACVSMLTLESTMLTTFDNGSMSLAERRFMLGASGGVVSVFIIAMAIVMIVQSTGKLKQLEASKETSKDGK